MCIRDRSGIAYDPDDVVWFHTEDRKVKPALMAKEMVQSGQLPDGIVCYNDQIAVQVMEELEKMGVDVYKRQDSQCFTNCMSTQGIFL